MGDSPGLPARLVRMGALFATGIIDADTELVVRRGVKDPAKMKLGMVLFGILSVLALVSLVKALLDDTGLEALTQSVVTATMNCCVFFGALKLNASAK